MSARFEVRLRTGVAREWRTFRDPTTVLRACTPGDVVTVFDGVKVTPPIECGLLPGTFRAQVLADAMVIERRVTVAELRSADRIWLINSVRGWLPAVLLE
jgi:branched-subunit amino acid aminotransferase/4-amino-4-deoxychorismate lyase